MKIDDAVLMWGHNRVEVVYMPGLVERPEWCSGWLRMRDEVVSDDDKMMAYIILLERAIWLSVGHHKVNLADCLQAFWAIDEFRREAVNAQPMIEIARDLDLDTLGSDQ